MRRGNVEQERAIKVRSLFLSDVHLGTRSCQVDLVLDFLKYIDADFIYLVGDIIDGWRLKDGWYWPQSHNDVVQKLLRKARKGARVIYIPGNHDEFLRDYVGAHFGGVELAQEIIHETDDGKRFLVFHGDKFDMVVRHARWLAHLGDWAYDLAVTTNIVISAVRRRLGLSYWSLASWGKRKVKTAINFVTAFEAAVANEAHRLNVDGAICGHIHCPGKKLIDGKTYINTGDWVDSCSALIEHFGGAMEIVHWHEIGQHELLIENKIPLHRAA